MRVLLVLPGITPDAGAEQSTAVLAPGLMRRGVRLHLALLTSRQGLAPGLEAQGVVLHDLSSHRSTWSRARALRSVIRDVEPDVVHGVLHEASVPARLAVVGTGVPVLVSWTNTSYSADRFRELGRSAWKLRVVQVGDAVLARVSGAWFHAVTSGVGRVTASSLRVPPDRVLVGERGRDPDRFTDVDDEQVDAVRRSIGLPDGAPMVLAVGRQEAQKGYPGLIAAFDSVADRNSEVHLVIAGRTGSDSVGIAQAIGRARHGDRVLLIGHRDDLPLLFKAANLVVCASHREGAAGSLVEAMAAGAPIVSVQLDGLEDVLVDGVNACVVPRAELASGLLRVIGDAELAARLGNGGHETFIRRFTLSAATERMAEIYAEVARA